MKLSFDTAQLQAGYTASITSIVSAEKALAEGDKAQLTVLAATLFPQVTAMTQEILTSTDPIVQQQYLTGLAAVVVAKAAELGIDAITAQKQLIATETLRWVNIISTVLLSALLTA